MVDYKQRELDEVKLRNQERDKNTYETTRKIQDYEDKFMILTAEIERQNEILHNKGKEWEQLKSNYL